MSMFYKCFNSVWKEKKKNMNTLIPRKENMNTSLDHEHDVVYRCHVHY